MIMNNSYVTQFSWILQKLEKILLKADTFLT